MQEAGTVLPIVREVIDGKFHSVHTDGRIRIVGGEDDQRPDADGINYFTPICVEYWMNGTALYSYYDYCGRCAKYIGSLGEVREYCPRCGAGIAHYVFAFGTVRANIPYGDSLPDSLMFGGKR